MSQFDWSTESFAMIIARVIGDISDKVAVKGAKLVLCFGQQHNLKKGLKVFGMKGHEASTAKVMKPLLQSLIKCIAGTVLSQSVI